MQENNKPVLFNLFRIRTAMIFVGIIVLIISLLSVLFIPTEYTEINNLDNYGQYTGTSADSFVNAYISSFFPESIDPYFSDVVFSYKAENLDTYGFEAYLEFSINDEATFQKYIDTIVDKNLCHPFRYDSNYYEYSIENILALDIDPENDGTSLFEHQITGAKIRKILYSPETHRIIFYAMGVYDGGGIGTNYFNCLFQRFQIDPIEYAESSEPLLNQDPFGV